MIRVFAIRSRTLLRIFPKLVFFARFSFYIINIAGRISEAAMCGAGNIIFHNLGGPVKRNTPEFEPVGKHFVPGKPFTWATLVRIPDIK